MKDQGISSVIGCGQSRAKAPDVAVQKALAELDLTAAAFLLVFAPHGMALGALEKALSTHAQGVSAFGCSTAGAITQHGYDDEALMILAFPKRHFRCASVPISPMRHLNISVATEKIRDVARRFAHTAGWNRLALIFSDGLSLQEEMFAAAAEAGLGDVPVFGGSAGDGLEFEKTYVLHNGRFQSDAGVVVLIESDLGFVGLSFTHFLPTHRQVVVTSAEPEERIVCELNGSPAAREYARLIGYTPEALSPEIFAENPLMVRYGDSYHVRAVQRVEKGGCLKFFSAIDDGLILSIGQGNDRIGVLKSSLAIQDPSGQEPFFILGFECILRRLEFAQKQISQQVSQILGAAHVRGFCTYGEQHRGVHVNQTFVGIAFYPPEQGVMHG